MTTKNEPEYEFVLSIEWLDVIEELMDAVDDGSIEDFSWGISSSGPYIKDIIFKEDPE